MPAQVTLEAVTAQNWEDVVDLDVRDDQDGFVASNVYSLAESKFDPHAVPLAICADGEVVGFLMYEPRHDVGDPNTFMIYRFMIDENHQGRGYGREAITTLIADLSRRMDCNRILICFVKGNETARRFYESLGFRECGYNDDGEVEAEIILQA